MKKFLTLLLMVAAIGCLSCCSKKSENSETKESDQVTEAAETTASPFTGQFAGKKITANQGAAEKQEEADDFVKEERLCDMAQKYGFKLGACVSYSQLNRASYIKMLAEDFNTTTATNEFKAYSLLNQRKSMEAGVPAMSYGQADAIARMAQEKGIGIRGHVLVWDAYMTQWFFREGFKSDGAIVSKEEMEKRLKIYIEDVITHFETEFPGLVYCWDVVNEAVADGANEWIPDNPYHIRKSRGGQTNIFYQTMGEDYVKYAFKCAHDTVQKVNPNIKLFYNDYSTFYQGKRDAIIALIKYLNKDEKLCDGVGMQGYIGGYGQQNGCMSNNDLSLIKTAIKMYSDLGIEVQLTEVAVRNYDVLQMEKHGKFYGNLMRTIISACNEGANFTGLTIWGIADNPNLSKSDYSYKMNGPYCGLFDKDLKYKKAYKEVYKVLAE